MDENSLSVQNEYCTLVVNKIGGSISSFQLGKEGVNPFTFSLAHKTRSMEDVLFRGQFLCLGRWGDPSGGEQVSGLNKHGEFAKLTWSAVAGNLMICMNAFSSLEGLSAERKIELCTQSACYKLTDKIRNESALGRMYQIVQHPTLAYPFLNAGTIVECNATLGFDYASGVYERSQATLWPHVNSNEYGEINLELPNVPYSSVFPFIVNPEDEHGWITAWSPEHNTLTGFIWERKKYPWINHWLHWEKKGQGKPELIYRGLEFGNTGMHKPFKEILEKNLVNFLGQPSIGFIDSGEEHTYTFYSFLQAIPAGFKGVKNIRINEETISITEKETGKTVTINHKFSER